MRTDVFTLQSGSSVVFPILRAVLRGAGREAGCGQSLRGTELEERGKYAPAMPPMLARSGRPYFSAH